MLVVLMSMAFQERVSQLFRWPRATDLMLHHVNMPPAMIQNSWAEGWRSAGHLLIPGLGPLGIAWVSSKAWILPDFPLGFA